MGKNIAIIGAGLVGRLLAWQLLEQQYQVTLFDKDNGQGEHSAGMVAAAMLAPYGELLDSEPVVYQYGLQSMDIWVLWAQQLLETTGIDIALKITGSIVVAHRNDEGDFQHFWQRIKTHPIVNQSHIALLNNTQLQQYEPELSTRFNKACYLSQEGSLDNVALFSALAKRIKQLGGVRQHASFFNSVDESDPLLQAFNLVIDCRGFGAESNIKDLRGVRGEIMRVFAPEVNLTRPIRLMHPRYKLYIAPKPNHEYVIGATQIESDSEKNITIRSSMELMSALYSVHTGFAEAEVISQSARCRPAFNDNLPKMLVGNKHVVINGLYRHGYLLSPVVISQAVQYLQTKKKTIWPDIVHLAEVKSMSI